MSPEERAKKIVEHEGFTYDFKCELLLQDEDHLINLIKLEIIEAQREAVEKTRLFLLKELGEPLESCKS